MQGSLTSLMLAIQDSLGEVACSGLGFAATINAILNLLTVALIAYVTKITHRLDKEVSDGG